MKIHIKSLPHQEKDHDSVYAKILRKELGIITLADGMGGKGTTSAANTSRAACEQVGNGLSRIIENIRDRERLNVEERKVEIQRDLVDLIVQVNDHSLTGRRRAGDTISTKGDTTFHAGVIDLENKIFQVENIGDSSIMLIYTDGTLDYLTKKPRDDANPNSKPDKWLGMYPHLGDDLEQSNVKKDLEYFRVSFQDEVEIHSEFDEINGIAQQNNRTVPKQLARILLTTDGVTNTLKHDELEAIVAGAPIDDNYDEYILTQLAVAARYPYRKVMDRLNEEKVEKILKNILLEKGEGESKLIQGITDTGINGGRLTSPNGLRSVIAEISDTEAGREVRRYIAEKLGHLDDTTIVSINVLDDTEGGVYCLKEGEHIPNKLEGIIRYGPYVGIPTAESTIIQVPPQLPDRTDIDQSTPIQGPEQGPQIPDEAVGIIEVDPEDVISQISKEGIPEFGGADEPVTDEDHLDGILGEYEETKAQLKRANLTITEQTERLDELERTITKEQETKLGLEHSLEKLRSTYEETEENLRLKTAEAETAGRSLQERFSELETARADLETKAEELIQINQRLEAAETEISGLGETITEATAQYEVAIGELNEEHDALIVAKKSIIQGLRDISKRQATQNNELEQAIETHQEEITGYEKRIKGYDELVAELRATGERTSTEYEKQIIALRESHETITTRVNELEQLNSEVNERYATAAARVEELLKGSEAFNDWISPEAHATALAEKDTEHVTALGNKDAEHLAALEEGVREHATALDVKEREYVAALAEKDTEHVTALGNKDAEHLAALEEGVREHAAALDVKEKEYATALAEKDTEHVTALGNKDAEHLAALEEGIREHATALDVKEREYVAALGNKDAEHLAALDAKESEVEERYTGYLSNVDHLKLVQEAEEVIERRYTGQKDELEKLRKINLLKNVVIKRIESELNYTSQEYQARLDDIDRISSELESRSNELETRDDELESKVSELQNIRAELTQLQETYETSNAELQTLRTDYSQRQEMLEEAQTKITRYETELEELESLRKELTTYVGINEQLEQARTAKGELESRLTAAEGVIEQKRVAYEELEGQLKEANEGKTEVERLLQEAREKVKDYNELERKLGETTELVEEHKLTIEKLEESYEATITTLREKIVNVEAQRDERIPQETYDADIGIRDATIVERDEDIADLVTQLTDAKIERDERVSRKVYDTNIGERDATIATLREQLETAEAQRDKKVSRKVYDTNIGERDATITRLREQLETAEKERDENVSRKVYDTNIGERDATIATLREELERVEAQRDAKVPQNIYDSDVARAGDNGRIEGRGIGRIEGLRRGAEIRSALEAENTELRELLDDKVTELAIDMKTIESIKESLYNMRIRIDHETNDLFGASQTYHSRSEIKGTSKNRILDEQGNINEKEISVEYKHSNYHPENGTTHIFNVRGNVYRRHEKGKKQGQAKGKAKSIDIDCYVREVHDDRSGEIRYEVDTNSLEISAEAKHDILYSMARILNISEANQDSKYARKEKVKSAKKLTNLPSTEMASTEHPEGDATVIQGNMYHVKTRGRNRGKAEKLASNITIMYQPVTK
jgi:serine/threonine protein phosphatase PrpC/chromosome segregation ATPase